MDTAKKKVDSKHSIYAKNQPKRDLFRAVIGGTDTLREGGTKYLPKYPDELDAEYQARLNASTIDGVVADGHQGLVGKVFHEAPDTSKVKIDQKILDNIDNEGNNFSVFTKRAFADAFDGHAIILVDSPKAEGPVASLEDEQNLGVRPYWRIYQAKDVINWRWDVDERKQTRLALLVLKECPEVPDGDFGTKTIERYRVYRNQGVVTQELWEKVEGQAVGSEFVQVMDPMAMPKLTAIPAAIIGKLESEPWLLNESRLEIKAYQKESSFDIIEYLSIPVFYTVGYENEQPISLGAHTHVRLNGENAQIGFASIDSAGHTSLKATIDGIKQEIAGKLDAITKEAMPEGVGGDQTATEVVSDDSKSQARLIVWAQQLQDALNRALQFTGQFMGMGEDNAGTVELMTAWKVQKAKAEEAKKAADERAKAEVGKINADAAGAGKNG